MCVCARECVCVRIRVCVCVVGWMGGCVGECVCACCNIRSFVMTIAITGEL